MKILATDFDGTFYTGEECVPGNLAAVERWRKAGNVFGIVTGRPFQMIIPELRCHGITVDFLVCDNGAAIHDGAGNPVWSAAFDPEVSKAVFNLPELEEIIYYVVATRNGLAAHTQDNSDPYWDQVCDLGRRSKEKMLELSDVIQISTLFEGPEQAQAFAKHLDSLFPGKIVTHVNWRCCDSVPYGFNKAEGILRLAELKNWDRQNIFTMGDGCNDIPMLKAFASAAPVSSEKAVLEVVSRTFESAAAYIDALLKETVE